MDETNHEEMTPEEARRVLSVADEATVATPQDRERLERGLIQISLAVGALMLALRFTVGAPDAPGWLRQGGFGVAMALYVVAIVASVITMRRAKAAPRGFTSRYTVGLFGTMFLYAVYVVVIVGTDDSPLALGWTVFAAVVAMTPALLAARSISRLALR